MTITKRKRFDPQSVWVEVSIEEAVHELENDGIWRKGTARELLAKGHSLWSSLNFFRLKKSELIEGVGNNRLRKSSNVRRRQRLDMSLRPEVRFIRRYLFLDGKEKSKRQIRLFLSALQRSMFERNIRKTSKFSKHILHIQESLIQLLNRMKPHAWAIVRLKSEVVAEYSKIIGVEKQSATCLNGVSLKASNPPNMFQEGFVSLDQIGNYTGKVFVLKGKMGELLGSLERYMLAMTVEGEQGAGKTRFVFQLANCFADIGNSVGVYSLEIGRNSDLVARMRDQYVDPKNVGKIQITGQASNGIETVRKLAGNFDVIVIDSWNLLGADPKELNALRNDFQDKIWIAIFQRTSSGIIRGGTRPLYDAPINIEVVKSKDGFEHNYAHCTKNRYGATGVKYYIAA